MSLLRHPFRAVLRWPVDSMQKARRNAMIACTVLAERRAEIEEVERFLASVTPSVTASASASEAEAATL
jgi:hypothetical protein